MKGGAEGIYFPLRKESWYLFTMGKRSVVDRRERPLLNMAKADRKSGERPKKPKSRKDRRNHGKYNRGGRKGRRGNGIGAAGKNNHNTEHATYEIINRQSVEIRAILE